MDIQWYEADVMATQQYYPFGMLMPTSTDSSLRRQYSLNAYDYRYGFNGKEGDDEIKGDDNQQDYGMRIYDPRVGRFLSVDPIAREYPWFSPFHFAGNMPIAAIDLDGLEPFWIVGTTQKPNVTPETQKTAEYILNNIATTAHDPNIANIDFGFDWSENTGLGNDLLNNASDRSKAAEALANYVKTWHIKGQPITLIGYSHGGNVVAQAAPLIFEKLGVEVNIITLNTPASNWSETKTNPTGNPTGGQSYVEHPRWKENPDNPAIQKAVLNWYHFYVENDAVASGASGIYEGSDATYDSSKGSGFVKNIKIDTKNIPFGRGHFWPDENSGAIKTTWENDGLERQQDPSYSKSNGN